MQNEFDACDNLESEIRDFKIENPDQQDISKIKN